MTDLDIFSRIHDMPPVDTKFVAGRWHHDRVAFGGFALEARVFLKSLIVPRNNNCKFLVVGRARSGTTLLTRLLNGHSQIHCDGEVLKLNLFATKAHFLRLAGKSKAPVYGAKFLSYQMVQIHRMRDPQSFLGKLKDAGVTLIHLERNTFFQTLSLTAAQNSQRFHSDQGVKAPRALLQLDPQDFLKRIIWSEALLEYERAAMAGLDHIHVVYERDLADQDVQLKTLHEICHKLGVAPEQVDIPLKKVLPADPARIIENYDEVRATLTDAGYAHLLPQAG